MVLFSERVYMGRFSCASSELSLASLLVRTRKALVIAFGIALGIHLFLFQLRFAEEKGRVSRPLATKFIKREPRLVKPLELRKRPRPKPRIMHREVVMVKAKINRPVASTVPPSLRVLDSLAKPSSSPARTVGFQDLSLEGSLESEIIIGAKEPESKVNMALEMVDIDALDTGRYHAMVIQDPGDKKKIRGFFHIGLAYSVTMKEVVEKHQGYVDRITMAYKRLVEVMNKYTGIETDLIGRFPLDSPKLFKVPWVYIPSGPVFELTDGEAESLGRYVLSGGFLVADDMMHRKGMPGDIALRNMIKDALAAQGFKKGVDWDFEIIPNSHWIYHCFFDFEDGPPRSWSDQGGYWTFSGANNTAPDPTLDGVEINDRLVLIMSNQAFSNAWGDWNIRNGYLGLNPTRPLQFGINTIIFALTQEGSITKQAMRTVR